jgi:hypothetical protein
MTYDYEKRVGETILVEADFGELLSVERDEVVESVQVDALQHAEGSVVADYDLTTADRVAIELSAGEVVTFRNSYDISGHTDARLVLYAGEDAADGLIDEESIDEDGNALELHEGVAAVRVVGGTAGYGYRIRFTATTSLGCIRIIKKTLAVIP